MKVSGFTFIRNAVKFDYPVVEAIRSVLPLCDEFIIAVGNSEDETESLMLGINDPKIKIIHSVWDDSLREGGKVLAIETNKAFDAVSPDSDWAFYIQADEVVHEKYYDNIKNAMLQYKDDKRVEGLLFRYVHFYGNYDYVGDSRRWYRHEIRIIRNDKSIRSYRDAQGFRIHDRKLNVKPIDAAIYHYGWVKHPALQKEKEKNFHKLWHSDEWMKQNVADTDEFDYSKIDSLELFKGDHPLIMQKRIAEKNWNFVYDPKKKKLKFKDKVLLFIEKITGYRFFEYKNYRKI